MSIDPAWQLSLLCGSLRLLEEDYCDVPFSPQVLQFCADLSQMLMADAEARTFPDLITFAFFCRRAHLEQRKTMMNDALFRLGRGRVLHIAPANIPVNFAYSLVFGLLAGNANLVRLPSRAFPQIDVFCRVLTTLFQREEYRILQQQNALVRFSRESAFLPQMSPRFDAMMLWGGDQTLAWMRRLERHPRCVELAFPDRYSFAVLEASAVLALDAVGLDRLCAGFYNDTYLVDQNACSSPRLLVWLGDASTAAAAREKFWHALQQYVAGHYVPSAMQAIEKQLRILQVLDRFPLSLPLTAYGPAILVARLESVVHDNHLLTGQFGLFFEVVQTSLATVLPVVTPKYQTLTYFGMPASMLRDALLAARCKGIDRIVPVGAALDMDLVWDGYSLVQALSRIVSSR